MSLVTGLFCSSTALAEVAIETSVDRSIVPVGEQIELDVIVSNADGRISQPVIGSVEGFTSYSQGHSQEISIVNGRSSSRSIFSYVLVANSIGKKRLGPFRLTIAGREYEVAAVDVEVTAAGALPAPPGQGPVSAPSPRALPQGDVAPDDIFVRAWLDKDEAFVNEPIILTYTLFTRLSATYKGFEKEPVTTGFWVEDFPPEKTVKRTEQILHGMRYVVADVRKITLFPTQAGVYTVDPGVLSAAVEVRSQDPFDTFISGSVFGARRRGFSSLVSQVIQKSLPTEPMQLTVKALPEKGRPASFTGAVGRYEIDSSLDRGSAEAGTPVTHRLKIRGEGNIETLQLPAFPKLEGFKVYDASSSSQLSKARLVVEGEKTSETVIVPRKEGEYRIPPLQFSYFNPKTETYTELETPELKLKVSPGTEFSEEEAATPVPAALAGPEERRDVSVLSRDVRFIRLADDGKRVPPSRIDREPWFWPALVLAFLAWLLSALAAQARRFVRHDEKGARSRRSHSVARRKLKIAEKYLKEGRADGFYAELSRAVTGYFADRFGVPGQTLSAETIEERAGGAMPPKVLNDFRKLTGELSAGRFGKEEKSRDDLESVYDLAERVLSEAEKVKIK